MTRRMIGAAAGIAVFVVVRHAARVLRELQDEFSDNANLRWHGLIP